MIKIGLKTPGVVEFRFDVKTKFSEELVKKINKVCEPDKDGDFVFADSFKVEGVGHVASIIISEIKKGSGEFGLYFYYVRRRGRLSKKIPKIEQIFEILSELEEQVKFNCFLRLAFGKRAKTNTLVNLPIKISNNTDAIFNEIHGIHFVKIEKKELEYEVILDLLEGGGFTEAVIFPHKDVIAESTIATILGKGLDISSRFVSMKEE